MDDASEVVKRYSSRSKRGGEESFHQSLKPPKNNQSSTYGTVINTSVVDSLLVYPSSILSSHVPKQPGGWHMYALTRGCEFFELQLLKVSNLPPYFDLRAFTANNYVSLHRCIAPTRKVACSMPLNACQARHPSSNHVCKN